MIDGRHAIQGAQPTSTFVRILEQMLSTRETSEEARGDSCTDGACAT